MLKKFFIYILTKRYCCTLKKRELNFLRYFNGWSWLCLKTAIEHKLCHAQQSFDFHDLLNYPYSRFKCCFNCKFSLTNFECRTYMFSYEWEYFLYQGNERMIWWKRCEEACVFLWLSSCMFHSHLHSIFNKAKGRCNFSFTGELTEVSISLYINRISAVDENKEVN